MQTLGRPTAEIRLMGSKWLSSSRLWPLATCFFILTSIGLLIALIVVATSNDDDNNVVITSDRDKGGVCGSANPNGLTQSLAEPDNPGVFHDLTVKELKKLKTFLENYPNITAAKPSEARMNSSYIFMAELLMPKKVDVLKFLDNGGPQPPRHALVQILRGDKSPPVVEEYDCGPLPDVTQCTLIAFKNRRNPVEFSLRPNSDMEFSTMYETVLKDVDKKVGFILRESYNMTFTQCSDPSGCFDYAPIYAGTALHGDKNKRYLWMWPLYPIPYSLLHPVDFSVMLDLSSPNTDQWSVAKVWYAGRLFNTVDELIEGYNNKSIKVSRMTKPIYNEELFSTLHRRGDPLPPKPQRPPTQVEPDGKRYSIKDRKVEYMGWSFHFQMSYRFGPIVYDVRYKGQRIAYEIRLSEIAAYYSGYAPLAQCTDYVDSGDTIGGNSISLVPGGDCPEIATLINQTFMGQGGEEPTVYEASFCLFEFNNGYPLRRHLDYSYAGEGGPFYGGMLDSVLNLRSAHTIGNYDYIVDFIFHQNGVVQLRLMSTGYIQSNVFTLDERDYGMHIQDRITGNLHHHFALFKMDLDVGGTANRYETLDFTPVTVNHTTFPNHRYGQMKWTANLKTTEKEALYKYNFDTPRYHVVHNNSTRTKYGEIKAFRIQLNGMSKSLLPEGGSNEPSIPWVRHQMVVTTHKDEEGLTNYGMYDSGDPVIDFTKFYSDDEDIVDKDLVFWVSAGLIHLPHTEDFPVTPTVGNQLGVFLLPYNYFPECPSMGSRDAMYIRYKDPKNRAEGVKIDRYDQSHDQCLTPPSTLDHDLANNPHRVLSP